MARDAGISRTAQPSPYSDSLCPKTVRDRGSYLNSSSLPQGLGGVLGRSRRALTITQRNTICLDALCTWSYLPAGVPQGSLASEAGIYLGVEPKHTQGHSPFMCAWQSASHPVALPEEAVTAWEQSSSTSPVCMQCLPALHTMIATARSGL